MTKCFFCGQNIKEIDYKEVGILKRFISSQNKIQNRKKTGLCANHQNQLKKAIKRARFMSLLSFTSLESFTS